MLRGYYKLQQKKKNSKRGLKFNRLTEASLISSMTSATRICSHFPIQKKKKEEEEYVHVWVSRKKCIYSCRQNIDLFSLIIWWYLALYKLNDISRDVQTTLKFHLFVHNIVKYFET